LNGIFPFFYFRHDCFVDYLFSREEKTENFYFQSKKVKENELIGLVKADCFRFLYKADLETFFYWKDYFFKLWINPNFQLRSRLKNSSVYVHKNVLEGKFLSKGAYRLFPEMGAELAFAENMYDFKNQQYYFQTFFNWDFLPKFKQDHWHYSDQWDREYPKNRVAINFKNSLIKDNAQISFNLKQSYDFYSSYDIYPLERSAQQKHLLPLNLELEVNTNFFNLYFLQEYDWKDFKLVQSELCGSFSLGKIKCSLLSFYQHKKMQEVRNLFSDIPHFILLDFSVPLFNNATLSFQSRLYSANKKSTFLPFEGFKPLSNSLVLDYKGHCWGACVGFEERWYKDYGNWKNERAFTLLIRLESLGSVSRKFKRTPIYTQSYC